MNRFVYKGVTHAKLVCDLFDTKRLLHVLLLSANGGIYFCVDLPEVL
jgi:hypothetical protein